jgi:hypothetical protein
MDITSAYLVLKGKLSKETEDHLRANDKIFFGSKEVETLNNLVNSLSE